MKDLSSCNVLPRSFYQTPTLQLAKDLLGCLLIKETEEGLTSGYIVETEAYMGPEDRAAHSFNNRRTKRTEIMYAEAGRVYTYVMHTHCLVNVVSGQEEKPEAILIRAVEPRDGIDIMENRRPKKGKELTNGPGKLTKAMGITMEDYGGYFHEGPLYIAEGYRPDSIETGTRIGIGNSGEARDYPYRYCIRGNSFISKNI
ncbi:DNA-3-methyladenine glycosylase [Rossellomorea vietnamensis]|uniref:Putative 3-methyladenine DNA glycosylase n=1 Tax=Rossellomorea vietnamensis TaxID=218284 RepID=A0A5D4MH45_9BACI|nr:DNA-3-methyladenine glycosylase [Rossellomorea vietnamensis]TYS00386.1 DNA-3-methyladenine glycosylase [Rossellomorea vietnamensis]